MDLWSCNLFTILDVISVAFIELRLHLRAGIGVRNSWDADRLDTINRTTRNIMDGTWTWQKIRAKYTIHININIIIQKQLIICFVKFSLIKSRLEIVNLCIKFWWKLGRYYYVMTSRNSENVYILVLDIIEICIGSKQWRNVSSYYLFIW